MLCKRPKFISIKKEIDKLLQNLKFTCANTDLGCEKILNYEQVQNHDSICKFALVRCEAFDKCKTKTIRKDIEMHKSICPFFTVPCIYCLGQVPRIEMTAHEQNTCKGTHNC